MTNLAISPLKLNSIAAAQGIFTQQQNQTKIETNNNEKTNDKKADVHEMSEAIKATQGTSAKSRTKSVVDAKLKEILNDERALVRAATLGKKKETCTMQGVEMKIEQKYDKKNQKLTIKISTKDYKKTEVKDMKALQGEIKAQNKADKAEAKRCRNKKGLQEVRNGIWNYKTKNGKTLPVKLPNIFS